MALAGGWFVFFLPALPSGVAILERDLLQTALPWRTFLADRLRAGQFPEWYPLDALGGPFPGQIVTAVFHPATLLYLILQPAVVGLKWDVLLSFACALSGAYLAARALGASRTGSGTAAAAFAFGGYTVGVYDNLPYLHGIATLPWVLAAGARLCGRLAWRHAALLGAVWALVLLGGDAQSFLLVPLLLVPPLVEARSRGKALLLLAVAALVAALIAAVTLVPALSGLRESSRGAWTAHGGQEAAWAFHPRRLLGLFIPGFIPPDWLASTSVLLLGGKPGVWAETVFVGGVPLFLAVAGVTRRRLALAAAAVIALAVLLAFGERGLLPVAMRLLPALAKFRFPEKYLALAWTATIPLMALGFDRVRSSPRRFLPLAVAGALLCAGIAALSHAGRMVPLVMSHRDAPLSTALTAALHDAWSRGAARTAEVLLGAALILVLAQRSRNWLLLLAAGGFLEVWTANAAIIRLASSDVVSGAGAFTAFIRSEARQGTPPARVRTIAPMLNLPGTLPGVDNARARYLREVAFPDTSALDGVPSMGAALPALSRRDELLLTTKVEARGPFDGLLNGCFSVDTARAGPEVVATSSLFDLALLRVPCRPRAYLAAVRPVAGPREALAAMHQGLSEGEAVWEGGPALTSAQGAVRWRSAAPELLELEVDAEAPTALVVNDAFRSGWSATIDGSSTPLYATNVGVRGVAIPQGHHVVEMRYRTPGLVPGVALSCLGALLALVFAAWGSFRPRGTRAGPAT